jgi:predicted dehydrogenase
MKKNERKINLAVIGAGYWGRKVIAEYLRLSKVDPLFNLAGVCDLKDENLQFCKDNLHISKEKLSLEIDAILGDDAIDAVHICTPNETHYEFGSKALNANKSVLLEKPMALIATDAWTLVHLAQKNDLCLQVGHIYRFNNALKKIQELIAQNYLGELYYLKMQWTTLMPSQFNRDIIFDLGPHPVDIMNYLLQKWPVKVSCSAKSYREGTHEEVAYLTMEFGGKLMAHVELSWLQPGKIRDLHIIGEKRSATIDCVGQVVKIFETDGTNYMLEVPVNNTIFEETCHFVTSIRDKNNHKNPGTVGASSVAVLESLKKSLVEEKLVKVDMH